MPKSKFTPEIILKNTLQEIADGESDLGPSYTLAEIKKIAKRAVREWDASRLLLNQSGGNGAKRGV